MAQNPPGHDGSGALGRFCQARASDVPVRPALPGRGREYGGSAAQWRGRARSPRRTFQGVVEEDRCWDVVGAQPSVHHETKTQVIELSQHSAADLGSRSAAEHQALDVQAVTQCLDELKFLCQTTVNAPDPPASDLTRDTSTEPTLTLESLHFDKPPSSTEDELATSLQDVQRRLADNKLSQQAEGSSQAMACAFQDAQEIAWDTFSDSMLAYDRPLESQLDLLDRGICISRLSRGARAGLPMSRQGRSCQDHSRT